MSRTRKSMRFLGLLGLLTLVVVFMSVNKDQLTKKEANFIKELKQDPHINGPVTSINETLGIPEFVIVICRGNFSANDGKGFPRQLRQISVLLKSAAVLTSRTLKFNIVSDSFRTYQEVTNITQSWPKAYRQRIIFGNYKEVFYPSGTEKMRDMFRPCATACLFLAQLYEQKDELVFLDTDTLFLMPPEKLWDLLSRFNDQQVMGIAPCLYMYGPSFKTFPTYGTSGLNTGVILMNLKRIRSFEGGWTNTILEIVEKYGKKLKLADQDILNVLFSNKTTARQLFEMGCGWNYRFRLCLSGRNICKHAENVGVGLLHGSAYSFVTNEEPLFKAVFEAWEQYQLDESIDVLMTSLKAALESKKSSHGCSRTSSINQLLLRGMQDTLEWKKVCKG